MREGIAIEGLNPNATASNGKTNTSSLQVNHGAPPAPPKLGSKPVGMRQSLSNGSLQSLNTCTDSNRKSLIASAATGTLLNIEEKPNAKVPANPSQGAKVASAPPPPSHQTKPSLQSLANSRRPSMANLGISISRSPSSTGLDTARVTAASALASASICTAPATAGLIQSSFPTEGSSQVASVSASELATQLALVQEAVNQLTSMVTLQSEAINTLVARSKPASSEVSGNSILQWSELLSNFSSKLQALMEAEFARHTTAIESMLNNHGALQPMSRSSSINAGAPSLLTPSSGVSTTSRPQQMSPISSNRPTMVKSGTRENLEAALSRPATVTGSTDINTQASEDFKSVHLKKVNRSSLVLQQQEAQQLASQIASQITMARSKSISLLKPIAQPQALGAGGSEDTRNVLEPANVEEQTVGAGTESDAKLKTISAPPFSETGNSSPKAPISKRNSITGGLSGLFGRASTNDKLSSPAPLITAMVGAGTGGSQLILNGSLRGFSGLPASLDASVSDPGKRVHQSAIYEVIYTEQDYVRDLELVAEYYALAIDCFKIEKEEALSVFGSLDSIIAANKNLLEMLENKRKESETEVVEKVGEIFLNWCPSLEAYVAYCANQKTYSAKLGQVEQKLEWKKLLEKFKSDSRAGGFSLESFLLKPVQRICKYPMLIAEILKHTSSSSDDVAPLNKALELTRNLLGYINEETRSKEIHEKFQEHLALVDGGEFLKLNSKRGLLMGYLQISSSFTSKDRFVMLFDDLIVVLKPVKARFQVESSFNLVDLLVHEKTDSRRSFKLIIYNSVTDKRETVAMQCSSEEDRRLWINAISIAASALTSAGRVAGAASGSSSDIHSNSNVTESALNVHDLRGVTLESNYDLSSTGKVKNISQTFDNIQRENNGVMHSLQRSGSAYASTSNIRASLSSIFAPNKSNVLNTSPGTIGSISNITATLNPKAKPFIANLSTDVQVSNGNLSLTARSTNDLNGTTRTRARAATVNSFIPEKSVVST